jgi:hypothetical protein
VDEYRIEYAAPNRSRASCTSAGGDGPPPTTIVSTDDRSRSSQQRDLRGDAADRPQPMPFDQVDGNARSPPLLYQHGAPEAQVPLQLGHEPDVAELGAAQHGPARAPHVEAAGVDARDRCELAVREHRALGFAARPRREHDRRDAIGIRRERSGCPASVVDPIDHDVGLQPLEHARPLGGR